MLALLVGPVLGETTPHFPLYIVEAAGRRGGRIVASRPADRCASGSSRGLGIGTVGLAAEWAWSHIWMPLPWPSAAVPRRRPSSASPRRSPARLIGAWIGAHLSVEPVERSPRLRHAAVCSAAVLAALVAYGLYTPTQEGVSAQVALDDVGGGGREVQATVRLDPPDAAADAEWFDVTAWQGGGLVVERLRRTGPGVYRTTEPIPVYGNWKAMIRLHDGSSLTALPIFLPRDEAIPVGEIPAPAAFTRSFGDEHQLLQREQKGGSPLLVAVAYSTVVGIALSLLVLLAWALHRLSVGLRPSPRRRRLRPGSLPGFQHGGGG